MGKQLKESSNRNAISLVSPERDSEIPKNLKDILDSFDCPVLSMNYSSAELAKISINLFLVSSVTTTNMIAELCQNLNASWTDIKTALRLDRRIGEYAYLNPGLGISGGNLERDMVNLSLSLVNKGLDQNS